MECAAISIKQAMTFRSFDALNLFLTVGKYASFTAAGAELNLTKGAVSYQMRQLEKELGFTLFERHQGGIRLTDKGKSLWFNAQSSFSELEKQIAALQQPEPASITIGMSTYFASRWLSPRLMTFISQYPDIRLKLQPIIGIGDLAMDDLDLMIRWGKGEWNDVHTELLFRCPAIPTAGVAVYKQIQQVGLEAALPGLTLLHDVEESTAWQDWYETAGFDYQPKQHSLVIPDPNVRVQAVIDGQGIALNDRLVSVEFESGRLFQISPAELDEYGYFLAYSAERLEKTELQAFQDWISNEATKNI